MRIAVEHVTLYSYRDEVTYSIQSLRLTPSGHAGQQVSEWRIESEPASTLAPARDAFGNAVHLLTIAQPHRELAIRVTGAVEVEDRRGIVQGAPEPAPLRVFLRRTPLTSATAEIADLARPSQPSEPIPRLHELMYRIRDRVDYLPGVTSTATSAAEALATAKGVCQDHAHIFIAAARAAGIPARYVTGYLLLAGQQRADAHHAWTEAWVDGLGWVGFDVANRVCPTERYVRLAVGLDALSATPIRGSRRGGGEERLAVDVLVTGSAAAQQQQSQQQGTSQQ
jgi:transglutaminase-like putative cysteine protease